MEHIGKGIKAFASAIMKAAPNLLKGALGLLAVGAAFVVFAVFAVFAAPHWAQGPWGGFAPPDPPDSWGASPPNPPDIMGGDSEARNC